MSDCSGNCEPQSRDSLILCTRGLTVTSRRESKALLREVNFDVPRGLVTGIIGPSGAGKSTLLKCLNRLIDLHPSLKVDGVVLFDGCDVRDRSVDPDELRRRVGIVFQQPVTFPGSIRKNVLFAAKKLGIVKKRDEENATERALTAAGLWKEVKDRLDRPAAALSAGQQQRLAIARTLAGNPDVILMDEPTSALDPKSTALIEETIESLKGIKTIVIVTHHFEQARRLADWVACICPAPDGTGELVEANRCDTIFCSPQHPETASYLGISAC